MTLNDCWRIPDNVANSNDWRRDDPAEPGNRDLLGLGAVGSRFLKLLERNTSIAVVYRTMLEEFDVTPEILEADLLRLSDEMRKKGLLETVG